MVMYAGNMLETRAGRSACDARSAHPTPRVCFARSRAVDTERPKLESIPGTIIPADETVGQCAFATGVAWQAEACCEDRLAPRADGRSGHDSACIRIRDRRRVSDAPQVSASSSGRPRYRADFSERASLQVSRLADQGVRHDRRSTRTITPSTGGQPVDPQGESLGVIGESGSGKTTLARCVLGLEIAVRGHHGSTGRIDATSYARMLRSERRAVRRSVQCVFQDPYTSLNPARIGGCRASRGAGSEVRPSAARSALRTCSSSCAFRASYASRRRMRSRAVSDSASRSHAASR